MTTTAMRTATSSPLKSGVDLRLGAYQEVLGDLEEVDALICDPPYSAKTHNGHDQAVRELRLAGESDRIRTDRRDGTVYSVGKSRRSPVRFEAWDAEKVEEFVEFWSPRVKGWMVVMCDDILIPI